jgi:hypothetical protein
MSPQKYKTMTDFEDVSIEKMLRTAADMQSLFTTEDDNLSQIVSRYAEDELTMDELEYVSAAGQNGMSFQDFMKRATGSGRTKS